MSDQSISCETLQEEYVNLIRQVAATAQDFEDLLREVNDEQLVVKNGYAQKVFRILLERADSELLSIAFFGAFSSGKSFLISGLNKKIEVFQHQGRDQFAPQLPASPRHTSSIPVAVEPLPANQREDIFWVAFDGSDDWEQKTPAKLAIIKAYVTDLPNAVAERLTNKDRTRTVVKAKLGVASAPMKARLYDLPGFGAIGVNYDQVIRNFIQQADCLVYVAWAIRPLEEKDLDLLRDIYNHHKTTGKPVYFVLTQIDLSWDIDSASGKIKWEDVLEANNEFLFSNFVTPDGRPDSGFIGAGFMPVSPALEAKGISFSIQKPEPANELVRDSRMKALRERFDTYLESTSGPMHLAELAAEAQRTLAIMAQDILTRGGSESTPIEDAQKAIKGYKAQRSVLIEGKQELNETLTNLGQSAINRAFAGNDPDDLAKMLAERLEPKIDKGDVLSEKVLNEIELEKANIVREWVGRSSKSLIPRWAAAWESLLKQSNERVETLLDKALEAHDKAVQIEDETSADISVEDVTKRARRRAVLGDQKEQTLKDTIDVLSTTWKTWTLVAGIGATGIISSIAIAAAAPALALLGPAGLALLVSAGGGTIYGKWKLSKQRNKRRQEIRDDLPDYAQRVINSYQAQADEFIKSRIGVLLERIDNEIERLNSSIGSLEQRLLTGEYADRAARLRTLNRLTQRCADINIQINNFYKAAASLQPSVGSILRPI